MTLPIQRSAHRNLTSRELADRLAIRELVDADVAVYQDDRWLILDDLTLTLVQDTDESEYAPLFVLDDRGVRLFQTR